MQEDFRLLEGEFSGFCVVENSDSDDFIDLSQAVLRANETENVHLIFEVPDEVCDSTESLTAVLVIDGNTYTHIVR